MTRIETHLADSPLTGQSKWWGEPDMPEELDWPTVMVRDEDGESYDDPLTFVCQIRCADIAPFDPHELLPHEGMLYFFAAIDYFLGDFDTPAYPGMGEWKKEFFRVHYSPSLDQLHTQRVRGQVTDTSSADTVLRGIEELANMGTGSVPMFDRFIVRKYSTKKNLSGLHTSRITDL